jgi:hypothetical protein
VENRWWTYQRERFPILAHGPLIAVFSYSTVCYSALLRGQAALPAGRSALVAFLSALLFFLQLRIADEYKDFAEDSRYRPYRPVPRGLVKLRELGFLAISGAMVQLLLALWLSPALVWLLLLVWLYLALMQKEFFVGHWLKAHHAAYMGAHLLILPLVDFYVTACDWLVVGALPSRGLAWLLIISFFNGAVLEIGRKIRGPADEEKGVETYSAVWGRMNAVNAWLAAMLLTAMGATIAARSIHFATAVAGLMALLLTGAAVTGSRFLRLPIAARARLLEGVSGLWTLLLYLSLGIIPLVIRLK